MSRFLIVDGHAYAYRAFHAIRELRGPKGEPTNAIYGFVKMLEKLRSQLKPQYLIVVWDGGLSEQRTAALPEYKAQRPPMPEDLRPQLAEIASYLAAEGVASYRAQGVEADDYIGCLARQAEKMDWHVVIASSDKDFMQLVSNQIGLVNPNDKTGTIWKREQVAAKAGVEPEQIIDWLALMGDAVDNIPGVRGVGPKTAADLLKQFGSVSGLYARLSEVKSDKLRTALQDAESAVRRNLELVRLQEVSCEVVAEQLAVRLADGKELRQLFQRWGFKGMLETLAARWPEQQAELI